MYYVYILASGRNGTLYIGSTNDLVRRVWEHRTKAATGFTSRYEVNRLVHFEVFDDYPNAAQREKRLKKWERAWKLALIEPNCVSGLALRITDTVSLVDAWFDVNVSKLPAALAVKPAGKALGGSSCA